MAAILENAVIFTVTLCACYMPKSLFCYNLNRACKILQALISLKTNKIFLNKEGKAANKWRKNFQNISIEIKGKGIRIVKLIP